VPYAVPNDVSVTKGGDALRLGSSDILVIEIIVKFDFNFVMEH